MVTLWVKLELFITSISPKITLVIHVTAAQVVVTEWSLCVERAYLQLMSVVSRSSLNLPVSLNNSEAFVDEVKIKHCARGKLMIGQSLVQV